MGVQIFGPGALEKAIAPLYSSSSTYALKDCVMYEGKLYRCTTAISTAESWNPAHWTETCATNEGGGLPEVSSLDNGKFLRVNNGIWAAVTVPDASGVSF